MKPDNTMQIATVTAVFNGKQVNFVATSHPDKGSVAEFAEASAHIMCMIFEEADGFIQQGNAVKPNLPHILRKCADNIEANAAKQGAK